MERADRQGFPASATFQWRRVLGRAEVIYVPDTFWSRVTDWTPAGIHLREDAGKPLNRRIYEGLR